jgi:hypothetical protein
MASPLFYVLAEIEIKTRISDLDHWLADYTFSWPGHDELPSDARSGSEVSGERVTQAPTNPRRRKTMHVRAPTPEGIARGLRALARG